MQNLHGLKLFLSFCLVCLSKISLAGNWSGGGGGELLGHAQNPWFLSNASLFNTPTKTAPIKYCVIAGQDFPIDQRKLETFVFKSLAWWSRQFSNAYVPDNIVYINNNKINLKVIVNTNNFVLENCQESTDLTLQFGYLTAEQEREFENRKTDLSRFVALTIRTDYSSNLHGKGFIYFSPDRGPKAFRGPKVIPDAWTKDDKDSVRLQSVIIHELGHVLGLTHSSETASIMSANYPELIVSSEYWKYNALLNNAVFFPSSRNISNYCNSSEDHKLFRQFFEIPEGMKCIELQLSLNYLKVIVKEHPDARREVIGKATFQDGGDRRHQQLVMLNIPENQTLFRGLPSYISSLAGPQSSEVQQTAIFKFENSNKVKEIFVQSSPRYFQIGGVLNNKFVPDLLPGNGSGQIYSGWESR